MESFNRRAHLYRQQSHLQRQLRGFLSRWVAGRVLDLGAGPAGLCHLPGVEFYIGVDSSPQMAELNPCPVWVADFDHFPIGEVVDRFRITQIVSFSALHWSKNLPHLFYQIGATGRDYLLLLFTGESFPELHRQLGTTSPLPPRGQILQWARQHLPNLHWGHCHPHLYFSSSRELFRYLKSGISGGVRVPVGRLWALRRNPPLRLGADLLLLSSNREPVEEFRSKFPFNWKGGGRDGEG